MYNVFKKPAREFSVTCSTVVHSTENYRKFCRLDDMEHKYLNMPELYENEHISSYVQRLLVANGFFSVGEFIKHLGYPERYRQNFEVFDYVALLKYLDIENWAEFFLKTTIYQTIAPFLTKERQVYWLSQNFNLQPVRTSCGGRRFQNKECPECNKKKAYIRTFHNYPGVNVCCEHKCALEIKGEPVIEQVSQEDIDYALFAKELSDRKLDMDLGILKEKFPDLNFRDSTYQNLILQLMKRFKKASEIIIEVPEASLENPEYKILYQSNILVDAIHKKCETRFCTTAYGFKTGFLCPKCQSEMSLSELMQLHLNLLGETSYTFEGEIEDIHKPVKFVHDCGEVLNIKMTKFLDGYRCKCKTIWTDGKIDNFVKENCPKFKYLGYRDKRLSFECECGEVLNITRPNFTRRMNMADKGRVLLCLKCDDIPVWTEEKAIRKIESLGFKYVSGFQNSTKPVNLLCENGHDVKKIFSVFLRNPICYKCIREKEKASFGTKEGETYQFLISHYKEDDLIYVKDVYEGINNRTKVNRETNKLCKDGFLFRPTIGVYTLLPDMPLEMVVTKMYDIDGKTNYLSGAFLLSEKERKTTSLRYKVYTSKAQSRADRIIKGVRVYIIPLFDKYKSKEWMQNHYKGRKKSVSEE